MDQKVDHHNLSLCFISKVGKQVLTGKGIEKSKLDQDSTAKKNIQCKSIKGQHIWKKIIQNTRAYGAIQTIIATYRVLHLQHTSYYICNGWWCNCEHTDNCNTDCKTYRVLQLQLKQAVQYYKNKTRNQIRNNKLEKKHTKIAIIQCHHRNCNIQGIKFVTTQGLQYNNKMQHKRALHLKHICY